MKSVVSDPAYFANSPISHGDKYGRTLAYVILSLSYGPWNPNALFSHVVSKSARMVPVFTVYPAEELQGGRVCHLLHKTTKIYFPR